MLISRCYSGLIDIAAATAATCSSSAGTRCCWCSTGAATRSARRRAALAMQRFIAEGGAAGESSVGPVQLVDVRGARLRRLPLLPRRPAPPRADRVRAVRVCSRWSSRTRPSRGRCSSRRARPRRSRDSSPPSASGAFLLRPDAGDDGAAASPRRARPGAVRPRGARAAVAARADRARTRSRPSTASVTAAFVKYSGTDELVRAARRGGSRRSPSSPTSSRPRPRSGASRGSSRTSTATAASSISSPARPRARATRKSACCATLRAIVDAHVGPPISVGVNRGPVLAGPIGSDPPNDLRGHGRHRQPRGPALLPARRRARSSPPATCCSARAPTSRRRRGSS